MKACMIITDGFEEIEAVGTFAILSRGGIEVDVYSLLDQDATGRFGITITKLRPFSSLHPKDYDALILPGGPEYVAIEASDAFQKLIRDFMGEEKVVAAICAAPTILGRAGFLKGKNYTCFTSMNENFGGTYLDQYAVTDGNLVTGLSAAATVDFGFAVLNRLMGKEAEEKTKAEIYYR